MIARNKFGVSIIMLGVFLMLNACGNKSSNKTESEEEMVTQSEETEMTEQTDVQDEVKYESTRTNIEINMEALAEAKRGDRIDLVFTELDKNYEMVIQRVQEQVPGIKSISANIISKETGLATLNLRDGRLSGILDIYGENMRYRIGYDSKQDQYFAVETKMESQEEMTKDDPMTPKMHDN